MGTNIFRAVNSTLIYLERGDEYLMLHRGETISTETLLEHIYSGDVDLFSNSIKVHIHSLRKKLGEGVITHIRGQGYLIAEEELS